MTIDYQSLFFDSIVSAVPIIADSFATAFATNPWPFLGIGALLVAGAFVPARRTRRRPRT
ncbi:hypothetical protein HD599_002501 [Conyzicola lurida]|uniref:Uncharacterized protein n=1 Tax=Conyzicola lurida TaxID=1172621 RepID=A0A841APD7_9MICO|nr:hypothetical protein [Conyzicola lurida]MBB5844178.1 hypothetical protein [Conyzicola lurida]